MVLDPIVDGFHLTRVLMDGGSSLNLLYQDTVRKMGIDPLRIKPTKTTFKGVIPGVEAHCTGSVTLEVVFGSPDNFQSEDDDEQPRQPNTVGQKKFPPQVKTLNMIYVTHIPKRERKRALRDVYAVESVAPKFNPWSSFLITFDRRDHPTSIHHGGSAALVLDPIINGFHLT